MVLRIENKKKKIFAFRHILRYENKEFEKNNNNKKKVLRNKLSSSSPYRIVPYVVKVSSFFSIFYSKYFF